MTAHRLVDARSVRLLGSLALERFAFFGLQSVLLVYMTQNRGLPHHISSGFLQLWVGAAALLAFAGGYLSDRFLGRYAAILTFTSFCLLGFFFLIFWDDRVGLYWGMATLSIGSGSLQPIYATALGDCQKRFDFWYWTVNAAALSALLVVPSLHAWAGAENTLSSLGIAMMVSAGILLQGHRSLNDTRPARPLLGKIFLAFLRRKHLRRLFQSSHVEGARHFAQVVALVAALTCFWTLFYKLSHAWTAQTAALGNQFLGISVQALTFQVASPVFVLIWLPVLGFLVYPRLALNSYQKIQFGVLVGAAAFFLSGLLQHVIETGYQWSLGWQLIPILLGAAAEVMVLVATVEITYRRCPPGLRATALSFVFVSSFVGNQLALHTDLTGSFQPAGAFYFIGLLLLTLSIVLIYLRPRTND